MRQLARWTGSVENYVVSMSACTSWRAIEGVKVHRKMRCTAVRPRAGVAETQEGRNRVVRFIQPVITPAIQARFLDECAHLHLVLVDGLGELGLIMLGRLLLG